MISRNYNTCSFEDIPTPLGLSLESIVSEVDFRLDEERQIPTSQYLQNISLVHFDVYTIVRDLIYSYTNISRANSNMVKTELINVLNALSNIPELVGIVKFFNTYKSHIEMRKIKSVKRRDITFKVHRDGTMVKMKEEMIISVMSSLSVLGYEVMDNPNIGGDSNLLYTHNAYWLSKQRRHNSNVRVLESRTGLILDQFTLNKKFRTSKKFDKLLLPFTTELLLLFGDKGNMNGTNNDELKKLIIMSKKWNMHTPFRIVLHHLSR